MNRTERSRASFEGGGLDVLDVAELGRVEGGGADRVVCVPGGGTLDGGAIGPEHHVFDGTPVYPVIRRPGA